MFPLVANLQKPFRIIRDDAIHALLDAPPHVIVIVDRPDEERAAGSFGIADEARSTRAEEGDFQDIE